MSKPVVYFIRHGLTDWNVAKRFQGQRDIPINDVGRAQALAMGEMLKREIESPEKFDYIASPLARTMETMNLVRLALGLPPDGFSLDGRLKEVGYGDWEGSTEDEIEQQFPDMIESRNASKFETVAPNGESYKMLLDRIRAWLPYIVRDSIVVTHGGIIRVLMHHLNGMDAEEAVREVVHQDRIFKWDGDVAGWL